MFSRLIRAPWFILTVAIATVAQTGGTYDLSHNVIASGGGSNSTGGTYVVGGTVGQPIAGVQSSGGTLNVRGGFWTPHLLATTAAGVSISGRIRTATGAGIQNVALTLTNASTGEIRTSRSTSFGYYRFVDIPVGQVYVLTVTARRYSFDPSSRVLIIHDELNDEDFVALPD